MKTKSNGSASDVIARAKNMVKNLKKENYPETLEITTGNSFPNKDELMFMHDINSALINRFPDYVVLKESDIELSTGLIRVKLTKK